MKTYEIIERTDVKVINGREISFKSFYDTDCYTNIETGAKRFYDINKAEKKLQELQASAPEGTTYRLKTCYADEPRISMDRLQVREEIGRTIRQARKAKGWTREQLAEKASITTTHVVNIEDCAFAPRVDIINRLCKVLNIEITLPLK